MKIKELWKKYREIVTYLIFGVLTTLVDFVVFWLFSRILGEEYYLLSNVIAWVAAVAFAYLTNKLFVFESKSFAPRVLLRELLPFIGARVFSLGVEEAGLWLLVSVCGMTGTYFHFIIDVTGELTAKAILAVVVVILNYVFSKLWIFRKKENAETPKPGEPRKE